MWICWFWSMATPGICASTSVSGAVLPWGRAAMSSAVAVYWLAPEGETAGPCSALLSITTVLSVVSGPVLPAAVSSSARAARVTNASRASSPRPAALRCCAGAPRRQARDIMFTVDNINTNRSHLHLIANRKRRSNSGLVLLALRRAYGGEGRARDLPLPGAQARGIPTAAESLDEGDAGCEAVLANCQQRLCIAEGNALLLHHGRVGHRPCAVLVERHLRGEVRGLGSLVLHLVLLLQYPERRELVLDLLEGGEGGLAVVGHRGVVGGTGLAHSRMPCTEIQQRHG